MYYVVCEPALPCGFLINDHSFLTGKPIGKGERGKPRWHWDDWELFLVPGVTGGCTGTVVTGARGRGETQ